MDWQVILVFVIFAASLVYFGFRFYSAQIKRKSGKSHHCHDGDCGCK